MPSYAIPCASAVTEEEDTFQMCDECSASWHSAPQPHFISGFSDFEGIDKGMTAFVQSHPPLIATRSHAQELADELSGVECVNAGYGEWDQSETLVGRARFSREPLLGSLCVVATHSDATDVRGVDVPLCPKCGRIPSLGSNITEEGQQCLFPRFRTWKPADLFLMDGLGDSEGTVICESGLATMKAFGFSNLRLAEIRWAEDL
jgi:hypothetical protein